MMDRFAVLIGAWEMELSVDGQPVALGLTVYGWLEDGRFMVQHSTGEVIDSAPQQWHEHWPRTSTSIVGLDDTAEEFSMLYADVRGVSRVYRLRLDKDVLTIWREAPGFHQRFTGTLSEDAGTIVAKWELSEDGEDWSTDFDVVYRRVPGAEITPA